MIELHTVPTPNGHKVSIMLEEVGLPYEVVPYDLLGGVQANRTLLAINPNGKLPAILDRDPEGGGDPVPVFESGAILIYLAEKAGRFLPETPAARAQTLSWLMFQMAGLGPLHGQAHHFIRYAPEKVPYALERYEKEAKRLLGVMEARLGDVAFLAGDYTIADMACWPWIRSIRLIGLDINDYPHLQRWFDAVSARPGVQRGKGLISERVYDLPPRMKAALSPQQWRALFGESAFVAASR